MLQALIFKAFHFLGVRQRLLPIWSLVLGWSIALGHWSFASAPDISEIVRKLAENSNDPRIVALRDAFSYQRLSQVDYLNDTGEVKKQAFRRYLVAPEGGRPVSRLISINGKPATDKDDERRSAARETGDKSRVLSLSEELLARYDFTFFNEANLNGRKTWILRFSPKKNLSTDGFFDRLVNAMNGLIWIDSEEYQLAKAEIYLGKKVSFFGGIAGAIERMNLTLEARRLAPDIWLAEKTFIDFSGRKLFSAIRFRCYETCSDFKAPSEAPRSP